MANTVVGVFEDRYQAELAEEALKRQGFSDSDIDLSARGDENINPSATYENEDMHHEKEHKSSIGKFFSSLFEDEDEADQYRNVGEKGCVVTVHAESRERADIAADILDQYGAREPQDQDMGYVGKDNLNRENYDTTDTSYSRRSREGIYDESGYTAGGSGVSDTNFNNSDEANITTASADRDIIPDRDDINYRRETVGADNSNTFGLGPDALREGDMSTEAGTGTGTTGITGDIAAGESKKIPVIQEEMQVGKREVETGGVRLRARVFEKPVEENLRLRKERVYVERNPVNRPATEADYQAFKEGTIEATETTEVPVVNKESNVVEEVRLKKQVEEKEEKIRGSVRRQDVDVEQKRKDREFNPDLTDDDAL